MKNYPQQYLVIDDDKTNNIICELIIKKFDPSSNIDLFLSPETALDFIEKEYPKKYYNCPTIILLDINMPTMTGFEFLDMFKKMKKEIQNQFIIYMLSSSMEDFNYQASQYTIVKKLFSKPLKTSDLEEIWKEVVYNKINLQTNHNIELKK